LSLLASRHEFRETESDSIRAGSDGRWRMADGRFVIIAFAIRHLPSAI